jgi:glycosyltransferase involved in cell wall biosynthesis
MVQKASRHDETVSFAVDQMGDTQPLRFAIRESYADAGDRAPTAVTVSVIIPTKNEGENLPYVLPRIPASVNEIILVDGHSTDDTVQVAQSLCPKIRIVRQQGRGKGNALLEGFRAARGDILVMIDADGSTDPEEIPLFVQAVLAGADVAKGSRFMTGGGSSDITVWRKAGNDFLCFVVNWLFHVQYSDLCYGYNAFRRSCLSYIDMGSTGFEVEALLTLQFEKAGLRITEVPSHEHPRIHGISKLHPIRDGLRILRTIFTERFRRARETERQTAPMPIVADVRHLADVQGAFVDQDIGA